MLMQMIWKDMRICRLPILVEVVAIVAAFTIAWAVYSTANVSQNGIKTRLALVLESGSSLSLVGSGFALTMLAGTIIAAERADRSAEFIAALPPTRAQILASKVIVLGACSGVAFSVSWGSSVLAGWMDSISPSDRFHIPLRNLVPVLLVSIGVGWCASAHLDSTGPAVGLGFAAPLLVATAVHLASRLFGIPDDESIPAVVATCCNAAAAVCFLTGSVYFILRVEP